MLAKEKTPALARSVSHDVGHAESSSKKIDGTEARKRADEIKQILKTDILKSI